MAKFRIETHTLPAHWSSYLINGDASGIDDDDIAECDAYIERNNLPSPVDCGDSYFSWHSDAWPNIGGDVCDFVFLFCDDE